MKNTFFRNHTPMPKKTLRSHFETTIVVEHALRLYQKPVGFNYFTPTTIQSRKSQYQRWFEGDCNQ